jgi:uncharacterized tellurite resistance protein B-like protein
MAPIARSGFHLTDEGIQYWFLDVENVANFVGPVKSLEPVRPGEFLLETAKNMRYRVCVDAEQLVRFRSFGGMVRALGEEGSADPPKPHWGFQSTSQGIFLWFRGKAGVKHLGPIAALDHLHDDKYSFVGNGVSHSIRLTAETLANFTRLGGTVVNRTRVTSADPSSRLVSCPQPEKQEPQASRGDKEGIGNADGRHPLLWHGIGRPLQIGPYKVEDPLLYCSRGPSAVAEASCIDLSLPVGQPVVESVGALGYWPEYRRISPNQRANYLSWLASGCKADLRDIGYAFIYFYGLERRALLENQDINPVFEQVIRLLRRYTFSGSFTGYLTRFLAYIIARTGLEKLRKEWFELVFQGILGTGNEDMLALSLGWHVKRQEPLSLVWAMRMAKQHPHASQSVVVQRAAEQFHALFSKKYRDHFPQGFQVQGSRRDRNVEYGQPASPSLLAIRSGKHSLAGSVTIPNVLGLQSQFLPLVIIWDECIAELKPVSRRLAAGAKADPREVFESLPDALKAETDHPDKARWDSLAAEHTREDGFVGVPILRLAGVHGIPKRRNLSLGQSDSLAETAQWVGYCVEPDARLTRRTYSWQDVVALFRPHGDEHLPGDQRYASAALIMELGIAVAAADGTLTDEETSRIGQFLEGQFALDQVEVRRLKQLEHIYRISPPVLSRVAKALRKSLSQDKRDTLGRFLVGVAAANGDINELTMKALRSAYRAMGLEVDDLGRLLAELRPLTPPPHTSEAAADADKPASAEPTALNQDLIRQIMTDTSVVAEILSQVMQEEETPYSEELTSVAVVSAEELPTGVPATFGGLPERFGALLAEILLRDELPASEFESLVRAQGLMPADAVARINEWAEENLGEFLIEEGEPIVIHRELMRAKI